uniref:C2 domain-containing protein n=1 Tax=Panagrolaimus superbus TaxID=310955 RepID=A0A914YKT4_9BILA
MPVQVLFYQNSYLSSAQRLSLSIQQATGLQRSGSENNNNGAPSSLVKAVLTFDGKILKKKKTTIKKNCICPIWNEVLTFEVDPRLISKCKMDLIVVDSCGGKILGSANLGENAGHGARIWKEALRGQSKVSRWLPLIAGPASR